MATDKDLMKFIEANPELAPMMAQMANDPKKIAALKAAPSLNAQDPKKLQNVLYESISICAICGKEQKTFTLYKAAVTQHICLSCRNHLGTLPAAEQEKTLQAALKKDYLGQAEAKFKAQQQYFKKQRQKQEEENKKKAKEGTLFQVTRESKSDREDI